MKRISIELVENILIYLQAVLLFLIIVAALAGPEAYAFAKEHFLKPFLGFGVTYAILTVSKPSRKTQTN